MARRDTLSRRSFLEYAAGGMATLAARFAPPDDTHAPRTFELEEATISQLQGGMRAGRYTARSLSEAYLGRIEALDRAGPMLRAVIETNPEALAIADQLDAERKSGRVRGPLHGVPVLIKDNIATGDRMMTTAGSLALAGASARRDAPLVARLRAAGAVILGKTNLSEWANFRSAHSSSGWSGRGGQCKNPYALDVLRRQGAVIVDPADIPHIGEYDDSELTVLLYEFKTDLAAYLAEWAPAANVRTLADVIAFNDANKTLELPYFGQDLFLQAQEKGPLTDQAYRDALEKDGRLSRGAGLDAIFAQETLDAIVAPTGSPPWPTDLVNGDHFLGGSSTPGAVAGYPSVSVPVGYAFGLPVGMSFIGRGGSEATLIKLAYAYEHAAQARRPPRFLPTAAL